MSNIKNGNKSVQFEVRKKPYKKIKKNGENVEKVPEKTERVELSLPFEEIYSRLISLKKLYTSHPNGF